MIVMAVFALWAAPGLSLGLSVSRGGPAGSGGSVAVGGSRALPATLTASLRSGAGLGGGRWATLVPPHLGVDQTWDLAAWTGKDLIAWGSTASCCGTVPGQAGGSSGQGAALDLATGSWRSLPAAPVDVTVEATTWTGHRVLVWGSPPAAPPARNVLLAFDPANWRWRRLAAPPIAPRSHAEVLWSGTKLIVIGGQGPSPSALLSGATYDPRSNRWSALPAMPRFAAGAGTTPEPVSVTAAWAAGSLHVWVTYRESGSCGVHCGEVSARVQALRWTGGASRWDPGLTPPERVLVYDATAVPMGRFVALLGGSSCLPGMSCPPGLGSGTPELLNLRTDRWSSIAANAVLDSGSSYVWTGRRLVAVNPYVTSEGYVLGGYAASFDPASDSWANLPPLPIPAVPPSGPVLSGTVWAGSQLIDSDLMLVPGSHPSTGGPAPVGTLQSCPPIPFPAWVDSHFCGPAPGPGNGSGPEGSCVGTETVPPCGPGMVAGKYYAYTLLSSCTNDYIDGRWWRNELPGGSGQLNVWISVNTTGSAAGWIGPNGAVGFEPSTAATC